MKRKEFLKTSTVLGASIIPMNSPLRAALDLDCFDKLVDNEGNFVQQPLPYRETFLEPVMDEETLHIHYSFHHAGAVKAANHDMQMIGQALKSEDLNVVEYWTKKLAHHFSSHMLHSIFWSNLTSKKLTPGAELLQQINRDFGSYDSLKNLLAKISISVDGNGWGVLGFHCATGKLHVLQCENHEKMILWGIVPILVIDVWEHSYYLKYRNRRSEFVENIFNIIDWDNVAERFKHAKRI